MNPLRQLESRLESALIRDRRRFQRRLQSLRRNRPSEQFEQQCDQLARPSMNPREFGGSGRTNCPVPAFNNRCRSWKSERRSRPNCFVARRLLSPAKPVPANRPNCLKSLWRQGSAGKGSIGHTQPRRIAAQAIASRLAEELQVPLGQQVGYKIRFADRTNPRTYVKLMTDGILLAETQSDRFLDQYQLIILDEAHERSLNIDFLIGYLKQLLPQRPDLQLIITSATIDAKRFSEHFADAEGPAPVIEVSGRTYPVEVRYRPMEEAEDEDLSPTDAIVQAIQEVATERSR